MEELSYNTKDHDYNLRDILNRSKCLFVNQNKVLLVNQNSVNKSTVINYDIKEFITKSTFQNEIEITSYNNRILKHENKKVDLDNNQQKRNSKIFDDTKE